MSEEWHWGEGTRGKRWEYWSSDGWYAPDCRENRDPSWHQDSKKEMWERNGWWPLPWAYNQNCGEDRGFTGDNRSRLPASTASPVHETARSRSRQRQWGSNPARKGPNDGGDAWSCRQSWYSEREWSHWKGEDKSGWKGEDKSGHSVLSASLPPPSPSQPPLPPPRHPPPPVERDPPRHPPPEPEGEPDRDEDSWDSWGGWKGQKKELIPEDVVPRNEAEEGKLEQVAAGISSISVSSDSDSGDVGKGKQDELLGMISEIFVGSESSTESTPVFEMVRDFARRIGLENYYLHALAGSVIHLTGLSKTPDKRQELFKELGSALGCSGVRVSGSYLKYEMKAMNGQKFLVVCGSEGLFESDTSMLQSFRAIFERHRENAIFLVEGEGMVGLEHFERYVTCAVHFCPIGKRMDKRYQEPAHKGQITCTLCIDVGASCREQAFWILIQQICSLFYQRMNLGRMLTLKAVADPKEFKKIPNVNIL